MGEFKGRLKNVPQEVVDKMLEYQWEHNKKRDITVFERNGLNAGGVGGFYWEKTKEGYWFWYKVLFLEKFDLFFSRYPKNK